MKIILNIVIACLILMSSNALNLSSSRRRASTEAAAYMKLTSLLGYTNGYKDINNYNSETVFYCDLVIEGKSVIETNVDIETHSKSSKTTPTSSLQTSSSSISSVDVKGEGSFSLKQTFELTIPTLKEVNSIESLNTLRLSQSLALSQEIKDIIFKSVDGDNYKLNIDPLKLLDVSTNWSPQTVRLNIVSTTTTTIRVDLVIRNFSTISNASDDDANENSVRNLGEAMLEIKKEKLDSLRKRVTIIGYNIESLQSAIKIKVMYLKKVKQITIYEGEIQRLKDERSKCLLERAKMQTEYNSHVLERVGIEVALQKLNVEIVTCRTLVDSITVQITSIDNKIKSTIDLEKKRLLDENKNSYTHIFYWLEAAYYYRVFKEKMVADVNEVTLKFTEEKLQKNSYLIKEAFYPLETDLTFIK